MNFKKYFLPIFLFLLPALCLAQPNKGKEKIETMKIAFITKKLDLTPKEAQAFWPLYNEYQQKKEDLRLNLISNRKKAQEDYSGLTDKEIAAMIDEELAYKQKDLDLQKEFNKKIITVLPVKKVALLYKAEEDFRKWLIIQLQNKSGN